MNLAIDVRGVTKSFDGKKAVDGVSLRVGQGEIYGFLGPNGSGKTTFIRMLCGLLKADGGMGTCLGFDFLTGSREIKNHVGYMTQRFIKKKVNRSRHHPFHTAKNVAYFHKMIVDY